MASSTDSVEYSLDTVLPQLGSVLKVLFEQGYKGSGAVLYQDLMQEMPSDTPEGMLYGALAILHGMGLVCIDEHDGVRSVSTSRHACFALGSLSKFVSAAVSAADIPEDSEQDYLVSLTHALESAREENPQADNEPLHSRKIVNVLIKSRQIRHWRPQDVYLHVYDSKWKCYHLVGRGRRDPSTDEEVAHQSLQQKVELYGYQYSLDTLKHLKEPTVTRISATSGALTEYTYRLMAVKEMHVKPGLQEKIDEGKFKQDHFRWFTLEEIKKLKSEQGEPIMFSTPIVMEQVMDLGSIPVSAPGADDMRRRVGILNELSCRLTNRQLVALIGFLLALPLLYFLPQALALLGGHPSTLWINLANIAKVVSVIFPLGAALVGALIALFRKSSK